MRIVSGTLKGRTIKAVKGTNTRPTTDKIKESIFNIIGPYFEGGWALDLYGGSGNLAIEALSRGIDQAILVDKEMIAIQTIKSNLKELHLESRAEVYRNDAFKALKALTKRDIKFELILLDPPYKGQRINEIIEFIQENELLADGGLIMAECLKEDELHDEFGDIIRIKHELYGITAISIYERQVKEQS